LYGQHYKA